MKNAAVVTHSRAEECSGERGRVRGDSGRAEFVHQYVAAAAAATIQLVALSVCVCVPSVCLFIRYNYYRHTHTHTHTRFTLDGWNKLLMRKINIACFCALHISAITSKCGSIRVRGRVWACVCVRHWCAAVRAKRHVHKLKLQHTFRQISIRAHCMSLSSGSAEVCVCVYLWYQRSALWGRQYN